MPVREGSLEAPQRRPIEWRTDAYYEKRAVYAELARVYDICHGCRRCVNLCDAFPTLFDLVDNSPTMEVDGIAESDYLKVVDQCYLCDLCAETKCPYLPPHEWAVDFPNLMLRAKAHRFKHAKKDVRWRDRLITSTDRMFDVLSAPGIAPVANAAITSAPLRKAADRVLGIHRDAPIPTFERRTLSRRVADEIGSSLSVTPTEDTRGKVAIYVTCYGDHNDPGVVEDLIAVLNHNGMPVKVLKDAVCCAMPKFDLGDLEAVARHKDRNLPVFLEAVEQGWDILATVPSCVLMYRKELPMMFPDDASIARIAEAFFDPFEYLVLRHRGGLVKTDFPNSLGKVAYHVACHQRVQNIGGKTREFLGLIPDTEVTTIERCSGHDGSYVTRSETYEKAMKIARPVVNRIKQVSPDHYGSDCPLAGRMLQHGLGEGAPPALHPASMVRKAYGI